MAKAYTTWTVLDNKPIEKLAENLWNVSGMMANGTVQRRMVVARLDDGRLIIHNAIALDDAGMADLDAFGKVAALVVPNAFHRMDARIWKDRYPNAAVFCPGGATKGVSQVVPVDGDYTKAPSDGQISLIHLEGCKAREGVLQIRTASGATLVFNDALLNLPKRSYPQEAFLGPTGKVSVPRFFRWALVNDKRAFKAHLERLAETPDLERIIFGHGANLSEDPAGLLRAAANEV